MKKLLLFMVAGLTATAINAQQIKELSPVFIKNLTAKTPAIDSRVFTMPSGNPHASASSTANKTTVTAPRWYSYFDEVDSYNSNSMTATGSNNIHAFPIWFDSTIQQTFSSGAGKINFSAASIYYDPINFTLYNNTSLHLNEMQVTSTNAYSVDSISFNAVYEQSMSRPSTIVDTLVISMAASTSRYSINKNSTGNSWAGSYLPTGKDTLYGYTVGNVDSVNRCSFADVTGQPSYMWKVPLTAAMRDTGFNIKTFTLPVQNGSTVTPIQIPAGKGFNITVAFKSGDTWVPDVSNVADFHAFYVITGEVATGGQMPYYYYNYKDHNMSSIMFSTDLADFFPSIMIEGWNATTFNKEYHDIQARIVCPTCPLVTVGINDVKNVIGNVLAYPNPATESVKVKFTANESTEANVSLLNTLGQVVKVQNSIKVAKGQTSEANFNVNDLSSGVYFCTVEANGQRTTNRIVVTH